MVQVVSDFDLLRGQPDDAAGAQARSDAEFDVVEQLARAAGKPLSMSWLQRDPGGAQYEAMQKRVEAAVAAGLPLYLQTAARGIGAINGLDASFHPFMGFPAYKEVAHLPLGECAAALRVPERKARVLSEKSDTLSGDGTAVQMMTRRNAQYLGLQDRGVIAIGLRADLNVIDPVRLSVGTPKLLHDLPAGGKRFLQKAQGYVGTWVNGEQVQSAGVITTARPGRLVRMGRAFEVNWLCRG